MVRETYTYDNVNYGDMVARLAKPGQAIIDTLQPEKAHLWHMTSCVLGEVAELYEAFDVGANDKIDLENVTEELGDIEFYLEGLRQGLNIERTTHETGAVIHSPIKLTCGLMRESGKLFDTVKRYVIYNKGIIDISEVALRLENIEELLTHLRISQKIRREDTLAQNICKLGKRYKDLSYSDKAAQDRADKTGDQAA